MTMTLMFYHLMKIKIARVVKKQIDMHFLKLLVHQLEMEFNFEKTLLVKNHFDHKARKLDLFSEQRHAISTLDL